MHTQGRAVGRPLYLPNYIAKTFGNCRRAAQAAPAGTRIDMVKRYLAEALTDAVNDTASLDPRLVKHAVIIEHAEGEFDYKSPVCLRIAARCNQESFTIAERLVTFLRTKYGAGFDQIHISRPGYLNFTLSAQAYATALADLLKAITQESFTNATSLEVDSETRKFVESVSNRLLGVMEAALEPRCDFLTSRLLPPILPAGDKREFLINVAENPTVLLAYFEQTESSRLRKLATEKLCDMLAPTSTRAYALAQAVKDLLDKSKICAATSGITNVNISILLAAAWLLGYSDLDLLQ